MHNETERYRNTTCMTAFYTALRTLYIWFPTQFFIVLLLLQWIAWKFFFQNAKHETFLILLILFFILSKHITLFLFILALYVVS